MEVGGDKAKLRKARGVHEIKTGEKLQSVGALSKIERVSPSVHCPRRCSFALDLWKICAEKDVKWNG